MALTEREEEWLEGLLRAAADDPRALSAWERDTFLADQQSRYEQYGPAMALSPKQWGVLRRIADKLEHDTVGAGDAE